MHKRRMHKQVEVQLGSGWGITEILNTNDWVSTMRHLIALMALALVASFVKAEPPKFAKEQQDRIEALKKAIAEKKAEVAKLEAELAKLEPKTPPKEVEYLFAKVLEVGTAGPFGMTSIFAMRTSHSPAPITVEKVIDETRMIVSITTHGRGFATTSPSQVLMIETNTKGLADGKFLGVDAGSFEVIGTQKYEGKTYYVVKPYKK